MIFNIFIDLFYRQAIIKSGFWVDECDRKLWLWSVDEEQIALFNLSSKAICGFISPEVVWKFCSLATIVPTYIPSPDIQLQSNNQPSYPIPPFFDPMQHEIDLDNHQLIWDKQNPIVYFQKDDQILRFLMKEKSKSKVVSVSSFENEKSSLVVLWQVFITTNEEFHLLSPYILWISPSKGLSHPTLEPEQSSFLPSLPISPDSKIEGIECSGITDQDDLLFVRVDLILYSFSIQVLRFHKPLISLKTFVSSFCRTSLGSFL